MVTAPECEVCDDVVGELGVGGHTVVRGWVWPGSQRLANQRQGGVGRGKCRAPSG